MMNMMMMNGQIGIASLAAATLLAAGVGTTHAAESGDANHMNLVIERVDDDLNPAIGFLVMCNVNLPAVTGVTGVTLKVDDAFVAELDSEFPTEWDAELEFVDVPTMVAALDGVWSVEVAGTTPSVTTFDLDIETLTDGDLWPTPTLVTPAGGATGVPNDVVLEWTNPAGEATVDAILLEICDEDAEACQEDDTVFGAMSVSDTQWDPPVELTDGENELSIMYIDVDDAARVSGYTISSGAIVWGGSPFAPDGYPAATPLLALGAERIGVFTVGTACPADLDQNGTVGFGDLLAMLFAWGPCEGCPEDLNGDGVVAFADLLDLLFAWGACS